MANAEFLVKDIRGDELAPDRLQALFSELAKEGWKPVFTFGRENGSQSFTFGRNSR